MRCRLSTNSIPISDVQVGQAVDVIAQTPSPSGAGNVTQIVARNAPVLAVASAQDVILVGVTDSEALQMANATKLYVALSPETPWMPAASGTATPLSGANSTSNAEPSAASNSTVGTANPAPARGTATIPSHPSKKPQTQHREASP